MNYEVGGELEKLGRRGWRAKISYRKLPWLTVACLNWSFIAKKRYGWFTVHSPQRTAALSRMMEKSGIRGPGVAPTLSPPEGWKTAVPVCQGLFYRGFVRF